MTALLVVPAVIGLVSAYCWVAGVVYGKRGGGRTCDGKIGHGPYRILDCTPSDAHYGSNHTCRPCRRNFVDGRAAWLWPLAPVWLSFRAGRALFSWGEDVSVIAAPEDEEARK